MQATHKRTKQGKEKIMEQLLDYKQKPQLERILEMLKKMDDTTQRVMLGFMEGYMTASADSEKREKKRALKQ
jgi:hypothetical protein